MTSPVGAGFFVCPLLIGRDAELARLTGLFAAIPPGRVAFVGGDAGVGKSRLVHEFALTLANRGGPQLVGNCVPDAGAAYSVFVSALRRFTRTLPPAEIERLFEGAAHLASVLLPELGLAGSLSAAAVGAEDLAASFWHVLARLPGALVVFEDVHWADPDSLRMLAYLAREMGDLRLLVVATYRTDELHRRHPLASLMSDLGRARLSEDIRLDPLPREGLRTMVGAIFNGLRVSDDFLDTMEERTEGNPFFVEELAKTLVERGDIFRRDDVWARRPQAVLELPVTVRETLLARVLALPSDLSRVLHLAALAGELIDVDVLARAVGDEALVEAAIAAGIEQQLLVERRERGGVRYAFRHALTREAAGEQLLGPERRRAHRTIADALATVYADRLDEVVAELADHLAEAGESSRAADAALRAARRAVAKGAPDEAARRFDQALQLLPQDSPERLLLLLEAARGTEEASDLHQAAAFAREARQLAREQGNPALEAEAEWTLASDLHQSGDTRAAIAMLEDALRLVSGIDDWREAWTLRRLTRMYVLADRQEQAAALLERAKEIATQAGHHLALSEIYNTEMLMARSAAEFEAAFHRAVDEARAVGDVNAEISVLANRGYCCVWMGMFESAYESLSRAVELSQSQTPCTCMYFEAGLAWVAALLGRFDEARQLADPYRDSGQVPVRLVALAALTEVAERVGRDDDARLLADLQWELAAPTGESQRLVPAIAARARVGLRLPGRSRSADGRLCWEALRLTTNDRGMGSHWMFSPEYAWALAAASDRAELDRWVTATGELTQADDWPNNRAASLLCAAAQARLGGDTDESESRLTQALDLVRAMPYPTREVEALLELARVQVDQGEQDVAAASAHLAHSRARDIGAGALVARAAELIDELTGGSVVATVLFTDIVGSTERAAALGDLAWSDLLDEHNRIVRAELARFGGREIDNAGDGFLSAFDSPTRAVRCAAASIAGLRTAGITARAGVHSGECRQVGAKLTGLAVHVAARVLALAEPGEVLVSGTVRDLVAGSGFEFHDRGTHELRGVPGEWRLFCLAR
jgi:class 3 adenylate cyclase